MQNCSQKKKGRPGDGTRQTSGRAEVRVHAAARFARRFTLRTLLRALVAVAWCGLIFVSMVCWRIHSSNASEDRQAFPQAPLPARGERILIFSPHCDDEALGLGGYIRMATARGAHVRVVMVTNGDGFEAAAAWQFKRFPITPQLLRAFAADRQAEAIQADGILGVDSSDVVFLGFPDTGLAEIWNHHWTNPYFSARTGCNHNPYAHSLHPGQSYTGAAVLGDIEEEIDGFKPDLVLAPHPNDDHPDHWATSNFVRAGLADLVGRRDPAGQTARFRCYIVHHGDWPVPQGYHPRVKLAPPFSLAHTDTRWTQIALRPRAEQAKYKAISAYRTQMAMMSRFLLSFVRTSEIMGEVDPVPLERSSGSEARTLIAATPQSDTLLKTSRPDANIRSIRAEWEPDDLLVEVHIRGETSKRVRYTLYLKHLSQGGRNCADWQITAKADHAFVTLQGASAARTRWGFVGHIPTRLLSPDGTWFLAADTRSSRMLLDRSGWRQIILPGISSGPPRRPDPGSPWDVSYARPRGVGPGRLLVGTAPHTGRSSGVV